MAENKFTEQESLDVISQMLRQTKQNMKKGSGNIFLYYGYTAVALSIIVFVLVHFTQHWVWSALWLGMFIPGIVLKIRSAGRKPEVVTYIGKAIDNTWKVVGLLFGLSFVGILAFGYALGTLNLMLMLPLSLLYAAIGASITGVITNTRILTYAPLAGFVVALYMLVCLTINEPVTTFWHLYFGLAFLIMMVIPGHILNKKSAESCSKN